MLLLIGIDRSYCRNNKSRLLRSLGPHPKHRASTDTDIRIHTHHHQRTTALGHPQDILINYEEALSTIHYTQSAGEITVLPPLAFLYSLGNHMHMHTQTQICTHMQTMHTISQDEYGGTKQFSECKRNQFRSLVYS